MSTSSSSSSGIGVVGLLGVAFVVLKLCHVIEWPWLWVLAPFWIGLVVAVIVIVLVIGFALINEARKPNSRRRLSR